MKTNKYTVWILSLITGFCVFSCTDFDELNSNPTKSTNMDPNLQIATIQMRQSENHQEWARYLSYPAGFMNQWTASWATIEYGGHGKKYDNYMEQMWMAYYPIIIKNVVDVVERTKDKPEQVNIHSVGRILKVQCFLKLTDFYGDIPYFEAGKGYYTGNLKPKYDKQEDIYNDFFKELKEASEALNSSGDLITNDLYYNGNVAKWKKFANSLCLRIAMRLIKVDPTRAKTEAEAAIAAGTFESNDDLCYVKHENVVNPGSGEGQGNGMTTRLMGPEDMTQSTYRLSTELIKTMEDSKDPRIPLIGGCYLTDATRTDITKEVKDQLLLWQSMTLPAQRWTWDEGMWKPAITVVVNGTEVSVDHTFQRMQPSKLLTAFDAPFIHFSYAEVEFLKAEAAVRGWSTGDVAQSHFEKGLRAAVAQWSLFKGSVTPVDLESFVNFNVLQPATALMQINTQLWVLHLLDPIETWANWRRTGMPEIIFHNYLPSVNQSDGKTPRRLEYPIEEQKKNETNYRDAIARMGGTDSWMNRVWWDKE